MKRAIILGLALGLFAAASCANGQAVPTGGNDGGPGGGDSGPALDGSGPTDSGPAADAACTTDTDKDGVVDCKDKCPGTAAGSKVNTDGCADAQLTPKLEANFPPYGLTWTPTGDLGRPGGLVWTYTGINRGDLFHIYWIVCDDPNQPCGLSLDGPIDVPTEKWTYDAADSQLAGGKLVFTNSPGILLADNSTRPLTGRLTVTIVDANSVPIPWSDVATLGVTPLDGQYGAEIKGTGFTVTTLIEVEDSITNTWTPYLDYYDAAPTPDKSDAGPDGGDLAQVSFGGSFYDK